MPTTMGPIAMMLLDHQRSREIGNEMEKSAKPIASCAMPAAEGMVQR